MLAGALLFAAPARAAEDMYRQEGATIRLVALAPDGVGNVHGALSIELEPGWKTYWIAPGPVGLAPRLDFSGSTDLSDPSVDYPPPIRFAEGNDESVGYAEPTAFAISAKAAPGATPTLRLSAFLGICRELCVPVQVQLAAEPTDSLSDRALVRRAQATLPEDGGAPPPSLRWNHDRSALVMDADTTGSPLADVFVSAGDGWSFGRPTAVGNSGRALSLPVLARPAPGAELGPVNILLTRADSAQQFRAVTIPPR
ncbi:protein-disulfide reductase DsbD domain-containing protein [Aureimonas sp. SK2]|uniref:protein-disulfide reductase DsbD domain-containing protein n=1 Tax=Aureimonas sp. SK2 TaxID=3015992 RepID=UPI0024445A11|nr:protein-disulfide reductase DsbD domain-containing protein [Aureimonas sp. SK2]